MAIEGLELFAKRFRQASEMSQEKAHLARERFRGAPLARARKTSGYRRKSMLQCNSRARFKLLAAIPPTRGERYV